MTPLCSNEYFLSLYLTIKIWARNFYRLIEWRGRNPIHSIDWRWKLRENIIIVLVEINIFSNKQLLTLFKQPMLMIHLRLFVEWNCQIYTSNSFFLPLRIFRPYFLAILIFSGIAFWIKAINFSSTILNYLFSSRRRYLSPDR